MRRSGFGVLGIVALALALAPLQPVAASDSDRLPAAIARAFPRGLPVGGEVLDAHTVSFGGGAAILDFAPKDSTCTSGYVCLWTDANYTGQKAMFTDCCVWFNLSLWGFNDVMTSWKNTKTVDAKWAFNAGGGGTQRCMNSGSQNPQLSGANNDQASSLRVFTTSTAC
jgi:peptidase inhibitor family I36